MDTVRSVRRDLGEGVRGIRAFTLIELLVVVSIIALLISILLPALKGARESARRSVCLSNQRQQGVAASIYYDDNNGAFPTKYMVNANGPYGFDSWFSIRALSKSVKGSDVEISDIFVCPNAPFDQ